MTTNRLLIVASLLSLGASLVAQLFSCFCPGWRVLRVPGSRLNMAVWYATVCYDPGGPLFMRLQYDYSHSEECYTKSYYELYEGIRGSSISYFEDGNKIKFDMRYRDIVEWELEVTAALVACAIALYFVFRQNILNNQILQGAASRRLKKNKFVAGLIFSAFSGCLVFVPVYRIAKGNYELTADPRMAVEVPYSLIIAVVGGIASLVTSVSLAVLLSKRSLNTEGVLVPMTNTGPAVPTVTINNHAQQGV